MGSTIEVSHTFWWFRTVVEFPPGLGWWRLSAWPYLAIWYPDFSTTQSSGSPLQNISDKLLYLGRCLSCLVMNFLQVSLCCCIVGFGHVVECSLLLITCLILVAGLALQVPTVWECGFRLAWVFGFRGRSPTLWPGVVFGNLLLVVSH